MNISQSPLPRRVGLNTAVRRCQGSLSVIYGEYLKSHAGAFISALSDRYNGFAIPLAVGHPEIKDTNIFRAMHHVYFDLDAALIAKMEAKAKAAK